MHVQLMKFGCRSSFKYGVVLDHMIYGICFTSQVYYVKTIFFLYFLIFFVNAATLSLVFRFSGLNLRK